MRFCQFNRTFSWLVTAGAFFAACFPAAAQPTGQVDTLYTNKDYQPVGGRKEARYYRLLLKGAEMPHGIVRYYYLDGKLAAEGEYHQGEREGGFTCFYPNGNTRGEGNYRHDQEVGKWQWWYANGKPRQVQYYADQASVRNPALVPAYRMESFWDSTGRPVFSNGTGAYHTYHDNGQPESEGQFVDGYQQGKWTGYHENGQRYYEEEWQAGELVSGKSYSEDGARSYTYHHLAEVPAYPGGLPGLQRYLARTLRYPGAARRARIQGEVRVGFTIDQEGRVVNALVFKAIGGGCDEEALRVVNGMEKWTPGLVRGQPVPVAYVLPIRFLTQ